MQSSNLTLAFYFDLLFVNSIAEIQKTFFGNSTLEEKGYSYLEDYDYYIFDDIINPDGANPIFISQIITREDFLENILNFETIAVYNKISNEISIRLGEEEKADYLKNIYSDIQTLLKRVLKNEDDNAVLVEEKLLEMTENLKDRYFSIIQYHTVFSYLIKDTDTSCFKNKDLKYSFYVELYEVAYNLYIIDDTELEQNDFVNAFTQPNPQLLENKVRFIANNYIVAYFLESLKPFFNGFTHLAVEKSGVFVNKQNKPLKSTDIYASLSRGKSKIQNEMNKIDEHFLKLKEKHLK